MSNLEIMAAILTSANTLLAAGIWFRIGRLEGEMNASSGPISERMSNIENRVSRLEEKAMHQ